MIRASAMSPFLAFSSTISLLVRCSWYFLWDFSQSLFWTMLLMNSTRRRELSFIESYLLKSLFICFFSSTSRAIRDSIYSSTCFSSLPVFRRLMIMLSTAFISFSVDLRDVLNATNSIIVRPSPPLLSSYICRKLPSASYISLQPHKAL